MSTRNISFSFLLAGLLTAPAAAQVEISSFVGDPAELEDTFWFGQSLCNLGDLDGDDVDDVAIGVVMGPAVRIVSGKHGETLLTIPLPDRPTSLASIGDLDGDGAFDLVVGMSRYGLSQPSIGRAQLFGSRSGKTLRIKSGQSALDYFGEDVAGLGDVNGDGIPDFAVGAPGVDGSFGIGDVGALYVYSGADGSTILERVGPLLNNAFGTRISSAGDFDGDGDEDIAVIDQIKNLYVVDATQLSNSLTFEFPALHGDVAGVGDVDGDGRPEIAVGRPGFTSEPGNPLAGREGIVYTFDILGLDDTLRGEEFAETGSFLEPAGDWNGDGLPDIASGGAGWSVISGVGNGSVLESYLHPVTHRVCPVDDSDGDGQPELWRAVPSMPDLGVLSVGRVFKVTDDSPSGAALVDLGGPRGGGYGTSVAVLGDLNGDGRAEVAVGEPFRTGGTPWERGVVRVYSEGILLHQFEGGPFDQYGYAIAALDDVNVDGVPDFAVGRPQGKTGQAIVGRVDVISGKTGLVLRSHAGATVGARLGAAIALVPDVDGDSIDDYAVGAPRADVGGLARGRVRLYSGFTGAQIRSFVGVIGDEGFGEAIAGVPDLDGDGGGDLVIGAPRTFGLPFLPNAGRIDRYAGGTGVNLGSTFGTHVGGQFGRALASVGDLTGDGVGDVVVGSPLRDVVASGREGRVSLVSGATGAVVWSADGVFGEELGTSVTALGDIDLDGVPDFATGSPEGFDIAFQRSGAVKVWSGAGPTLLRTFTGDEVGSRFGASLGAMPGADVDGDRLADVVVGAPFGDRFTEPDVGNAATWSVRALGSSMFGPGTNGCAGDNLLVLAEPASPGDVVDLRVGGVEPGVLPVLLASLSPNVLGIDLGLGALAHVLPPFALFKIKPPATGGTLANTFNLPPDPTLSGISFHVQETLVWFVPCPQIPLGYSSTNGLTITIQ